MSAIAVAACLLAGCGSSGPGLKAVVISSGQIPPADVPAVKGKDGAGSSSAETVPLAKQSPTTALFTALGTFQSCLSGLGVTFAGAPNPNDPSSPANNPQYVKNLVTCATKSNILQALKTEQSAQDNLTPAQVESENKSYLRWRTCMIGRGWQIPKPTPNSKGLLFSFGGATSGTGTGFVPPPGQSLLSSSDLEQCAAVAQQGKT
jgi:hypothetical protein